MFITLITKVDHGQFCIVLPYMSVCE